MPLVMAADIGGTTSRIAFAERRVTLWSRASRSRDHAGVDELVARALEESRLHPVAACFGVAGPVIDGTCRVTNLPWTVDARELASVLGLASERVALINDVEAAARAIDALGGEDVETLQRSAVGPGPRLMACIGTGFGAAIVTEAGDVLPGEPGHATFAPEDDVERDLAALVTREHGRASVESIASGPGLARVHRALGGDPVDAAGIAAAARRGDERAIRSLETFSRLLGSALGNVALAPVARGGVYLAGGMPARLLPWLQGGDFLRRFNAKAPMEALLEAIPVHVVLREDVGLLGAARHATHLARSSG